MGSRSARNVPTGVGSRGGIGHRHADDPVAWAARCVRWRADHPEYRERERDRKALARARRNDSRPNVRFTDVIRSLLARGSSRQLASVLLIDNVTVWRGRTSDRVPGGETIDAVVEAFGPSEVLREWRRLRAVARDRREVDREVARLATSTSTSRSSRPEAA